MLPPNGTLALIDGQPAAVSFCFLTDADAAYITFIASDPRLPARQAVDALVRTLTATVAIAEQFLGGKGFIWLQSHNEGLIRLACSRVGFTDSGPVHSAFRLIGDDIDPDLLLEDTK